MYEPIARALLLAHMRLLRKLRFMIRDVRSVFEVRASRCIPTSQAVCKQKSKSISRFPVAQRLHESCPVLPILSRVQHNKNRQKRARDGEVRTQNFFPE